MRTLDVRHLTLLGSGPRQLLLAMLPVQHTVATTATDVHSDDEDSVPVKTTLDGKGEDGKKDKKKDKKASALLCGLKAFFSCRRRARSGLVNNLLMGQASLCTCRSTACCFCMLQVDVPLSRIVSLNKPEWPYGLVGLFWSAINGSLFPIFAFLLATFIHIFFQPTVRPWAHPLAPARGHLGLQCSAWCGHAAHCVPRPKALPWWCGAGYAAE